MSSSVLERTVSGGFTDYKRGSEGREGREGETYFAMPLTLTRSLLPSGSVYRWSAPEITFALIAGTKPGTEIIVPVFVVYSEGGVSLSCMQGAGRGG